MGAGYKGAAGSGIETWALSNMRSLFKETSDSVSCIFKIVLSYHVKDEFEKFKAKTALKAGSLLHCHRKGAEPPRPHSSG